MAQLLIFTPGVVKQLGSGFAGEVVAIKRASPRVIPRNFVAGAAARSGRFSRQRRSKDTLTALPPLLASILERAYACGLWIKDIFSNTENFAAS